MTKSAEEAYEASIHEIFKHPELTLGPWTSHSVVTDPKHLVFVLSRYKFCAKVLHGKARVLEVGCGDGIGQPVMSQHVGHLYCLDWDERLIEGNKRRLAHLENVSYVHHDINAGPPALEVDAAYAIDVIEHVEPQKEAAFMEHLVAPLTRTGVLVFGTPNVTASQYASPQSEAAHINLKSHDSLRTLMAQYFDNVFMFGMNDEVVHTGFGPMCHYLWAIGAGRRQ